jgi:hypothetical protein
MSKPNTAPVDHGSRPLIAAASALPPHVLAGVKALRRWDDLFPVTDAELAAAVAEFESVKLA